VTSLALLTASSRYPSEADRIQTMDSAPEDSGDVLHPYDFLQNPFKDKGSMVTLNVLPFPILAAGMLAEYQTLDSRIAVQAGIKGLRFNRMISESVALFDIMVVDPSESRDPQMRGQLAVFIKTGDQPPDDTRAWNVEPLGTFEGTNGFGAPIQIPAVRFWGYGQLDSAGRKSHKPQELTGDSLAAVNLVRQQIQPTDALLALHPDLQNAEWSALNNQSSCGNGCWYVDAHFRIHKESTDPVQYFENAGWQLNINQHTVIPNAGAVKYFNMSGTSN